MIERFKERFPLVRPLLIPFVLYLGLLPFTLNWIEDHPGSPWRNLVALAPVIPGAFIAWGMVRAIAKLDELSRKILLDGMAISFAFTLVLTMSLGFLGMAGLAMPNPVYISLFMVVMWLVGKLLVTSRYE
jgi:hypothetical protein